MPISSWKGKMGVIGKNVVVLSFRPRTGVDLGKLVTERMLPPPHPTPSVAKPMLIRQHHCNRYSKNSTVPFHVLATSFREL